MFHPGTTRLIRYWSGLAAGRAPLRAEFDPTQVADLLPQMFLLAREADRLAFRIAGEVLRDLHGRGLKGTDAFDLFTPTARPLAQRSALQAVREGAPMVLIATGRTSAGSELPLELTLAPLVGAHGAVDRLVGLCQPLASVRLLDGRTIAEIAVRMAAAASAGAHLRPGVRLVAIDGQRIA